MNKKLEQQIIDKIETLYNEGGFITQFITKMTPNRIFETINSYPQYKVDYYKTEVQVTFDLESLAKWLMENYEFKQKEKEKEVPFEQIEQVQKLIE